MKYGNTASLEYLQKVELHASLHTSLTALGKTTEMIDTGMLYHWLYNYNVPGIFIFFRICNFLFCRVLPQLFLHFLEIMSLVYYYKTTWIVMSPLYMFFL